MIRQFSVRRLRGRSEEQLVAVLQSHLLDGVDTVVIAPLLDAPAPARHGLAVSVTVEEKTLRLAVNQLATVPARALAGEVGSLRAYEDEIRRALERLFTGF